MSRPAERRSAYVGRFAPSPTGPLHFGSAVAAVGSYLQARASRGLWLLRIDDIDPPREMPGAARGIQQTLERLGLEWDGSVCYQSQRMSAYRAALETLHAAGLTYPCACTRRAIGRRPHGSACRSTAVAGRAGSMRVRVPTEPIRFHDHLHGEMVCSLPVEFGDFIVWRADGLVAYHLATAMDDAWQGVTEVVRGADLLDSTACQIHLLRLLSLPEPQYAHLPCVLDQAGNKLSKQTGATAVNTLDPRVVVRAALAFLGHPAPADMAAASVRLLIEWAVEHWDIGRVPRRSGTAVLVP